jgi:hypothetical protein
MKEDVSSDSEVHHDVIIRKFYFQLTSGIHTPVENLNTIALVLLSPEGRSDVWMLKVFKDVQKLHF